MENFAQLEKTVAETVQQAMVTKSFDLLKFFQQMESGFTTLGFRNNTLGGGAE